MDPGKPGRGGTAALLRQLVADACGRTPEEIEADRPLIEYGLSSRDAVGITGELERELGRGVPATLLWDHPTLSDLVRHLEQGVTPPEPPPPAQSDGIRDAVAVVGIGCRLPQGINGPYAFWDFLLNNGDAVGEVPAQRWQDCGEVIAATASQLPDITRWGAYLHDVAGFDAQFFGITPREAQLMDPQQRLLLEVVCEALDHAGLPAPMLQGGSTGVYVGLSSLEYGFLTTDRLDRITEWTSTGSAGSIVANRVSYALDLRGPSLTIDTACSSSLVALHQACRDLRAGACDTALAAGVNVLLSPAITVGFHEAGVLAPGGRCRPFDAGAEGIVRGEGCGVVVLKRLADAVREEHPILALVRGTAVNSDGRSAGLVAPSPAAQQSLLRSALRDAGLTAHDVDYVETHGTGTLLGDPIEAGALSAVLGLRRAPGRPLLIGSVKSNVGHLEGAAGIVSVIKTVLALRHKRLPATIHFRKPNPHIDFAAGRLRVVAESSPWPDGTGRPARAGVSAFGFGGTNAHAVLEEWAPKPSRARAASAPRRPRILIVSARTASRLADAATELAEWLAGPVGAETSLDDLTRTLGENRYGSVSAAVVGRDRATLIAGLRALGVGRPAKGVVAPQSFTEPTSAPRGGPVFVFSGYGAQWEGMGRRLMLEEPAFADAVEELDPIFAASVGMTLTRMLDERVRFNDVARIQPVLFGMQTALVRTWRAYGVEPSAVVGQSMGEVAAAVAAGALTAEHGLDVVVRRSELLRTVDASRSGAMAAIELPRDERADWLARFPGIEIAVDASPKRCTVAGPSATITGFLAELNERGGFGRLLDVGGAGHSPSVDPVLPALRKALAEVPHTPPQVPWYGTVYKDPRRTPRAGADYWCDNARRPVRLHQAVAAAAADGHRVFLEISPHPVTGLPVRETLDDASVGESVVLPSSRRDSDEPLVLHTTLAALHLAGAQSRPRLLWPTGRRTSLPPATWRHTRHWVDGTARGRVRAQGHALLGMRVDVPGTRRALWRGDVETSARDRRGEDDATPVALPLARCALLMLAAAAEVFAAADNELQVRDLALERLLPLSDGDAVITMLDPDGPGRAIVSIHSQSAVGTWRRHATGTVRVGPPVIPDGRAEYGGEPFTMDFPTPTPGTSTGVRRLDPALLDTVLRAPASARTQSTADPAEQLPPNAVPVAAEVLRVSATTGTPAACYGRPAAPDDAGIWSIRLEDTSGSVAVDAERVVLRAPAPGQGAPPLNDSAFELTWEKDPLPAGRDAGPAEWLLLDVEPANGRERADIAAQRLCAGLEEARRHVTVAHCEPDSVAQATVAWHRNLAAGASSAVVLLGPALTARDTVLLATRVARELTAEGPTPRLYLVQSQAAAVSAEDTGDPDRACLRGLVRVLALEHPDLRTCLVDTERSPDAVHDLLGELLVDGDADEVAWRGGTRFVARLSRAVVDATSAVPFARPRGAYIVTGGLTGLGLATARRLAERGAGRLVLNGRRPPAQGVEETLRSLRRMGSEVEVVLGDIAEPCTAPLLVDAAVANGHTLRGVAHAAGVLQDGIVRSIGPEELDTVFRPKADGGSHLDTATAGHDLDWWLMFSSAAALFGSPGQGAYAAANAWLDALVHRRRAGGLRAQSIAWGPWAGTGAAPDMTSLALEPIAPEEGLDTLELVVRSARPYTGVVRLDVQGVAAAFPAIESTPFFASVASGTIEQADSNGTIDDLRELDHDAALTSLRRLLAERTAAIMGFDGQDLDTTVPLTDIGLDSLMAVRIRNAVKRDFGAALPETLLLRGGSLNDIAVSLLSSLDLHSGPPTTGETDRSAPSLPQHALPRDAAERLVTGVWANVSGQPPADVREELEGIRDDHAVAARFAAQLRSRLGGTRRAVTVNDVRAHPTVAGVADLIRPLMEENGAGGPLRVLRTSGKRTGNAPLFVFHPAGGSTVVYQPLADLLPSDQPVFGLDRVESLASVGDKAGHYLDVMRRVQPEGPYSLLGWSFGGCLAYEAAARLEAAGESVGYLGLIDTILPAALPDVPEKELLLQRFQRFAEYVERVYGRPLRLPYEEMAAMDEQDQVDTLMRYVAEAGLDMSPGVMEHQRTSYIDARIGERYRPRPCADPVVLYRAQEPQGLTTAIDPRYLRDDDHLGWGPLCPRLTVVPVPGDHLSLIDPPNVEVIADHLRAVLRKHPWPRLEG
jgi:phthiocerol/phenolphthiocerol synthesis type-I polyketide synthase D